MAVEEQTSEIYSSDSEVTVSVSGIHSGAPTHSNLIHEATLYLAPLNESFASKSIPLFEGDKPTKIGRKVNSTSIPDATNAYFDAKVLSQPGREEV